MRAESFFFGNPFASEFELPPGFMGGVASAEQEQKEEEKYTPPLASNPLYTAGQLGSITDAYRNILALGATTDDPDEVASYYDLGLREAETTSGLDPFADTFGSEAAGMGGAPTALSNIVSAEDYLFSVTGKLPELPQDQGDFQGKLNRFTNASQENLGDFQNAIRTLLLDKVPQVQATTGANYEQALYDVYTKDPEVQQLMGQYGVNPLFSDGTGQYLYDPFSFGELRTYEINESDFSTGVRTLAEVGKAVMIAQVLGGAKEALGNIFADVPLFGEETVTTGVDAAGNPIYDVDTSGVTTIGDVFSGGSTATAGDSIGGFAGPVNMLSSIATAGKYYDPDDPLLQEERIETAAEQIKNRTSNRQEAEKILLEADLDPFTIKEILDTAYGVVRKVDLSEETTDTAEKIVKPDEPDEVTPPPETTFETIVDLNDVTSDVDMQDPQDPALNIPPPAIDTSEVGGSKTSSAAEAAEAQKGQESVKAPSAPSPSAPPPPPPPSAPPPASPPPPSSGGMFTQKQVDDFVSIALAGATSGLFTPEEVEEVKQTVLANLPEDTTLFDQGDIDAAVQKAVSEVEADFTTEKTGLESTIEGLEGELESAGTAIEGLETKLETSATALENAQDTASSLQAELNSANEAISNQTGTIAAQTESIQTLESSVTTLEGSIDSLNTKLTEVTEAKAAAIEAGNTALSEAMEAAETTLQNTISESATTLQNAIAAGETNVANAVQAGQDAVDAAVAAGNAAVEAAEAAGATATAEAVAAGETATAEAVAAGEAAATAAEAAGREEGFGEGFGEGQGQGRGEGAGVGTGIGLALGLGAGMLTPNSVTKTMFEDFKPVDLFERPELLKPIGLFGQYDFRPEIFKRTA